MFQEQLDRCHQNIEDHTGYMSKYKAMQDWLSTATRELQACSDMVGDEDSLKAKLAIVKVKTLYILIYMLI